MSSRMSLSQPNCRDKVDGILERRLGQVLDTQLIEAYLKLDTDQLASRKVRGIFTKVILSPTNPNSGQRFRCEESF
jgi:hypothetical protein